MFLIAELRQVDGKALGVLVLNRKVFTAPGDRTGREGWQGQGVVRIEGRHHMCRVQAIVMEAVAEAAGGRG